MKFKSRREAEDWCKIYHPASSRLGRAASAQRPRSGSDRVAKAETFRERGLPLAAYQLTYLAFPASGRKPSAALFSINLTGGSEDPRAPTYPRPALSLRETS